MEIVKVLGRPIDWIVEQVGDNLLANLCILVYTSVLGVVLSIPVVMLMLLL